MVQDAYVGHVQVIKGEGLIYMVLEYGDIDLARLLARHEAAQREGGATELDENFIRLYWQQMLQVSTLYFPPGHIQFLHITANQHTLLRKF